MHGVRYHRIMRSRASIWVGAAGAAALALAASIASGQTSPSQPQTSSIASQFPPGPGRDALFKVCKECHGPESVLASFKTHDEWVKTLDEMANNGATGTDEEWTQIQAYLDQHYSLIFVNKAPARDLALTLDVTAAAAEAIVKARESGNLKTIEDLKRVPGVDAAKIDARKERLIF
jgi:competence protein ComEA